MISIIDSFKDILTERFSVLKLLVFTIPLYYSFYAFGQKDLNNFYVIFFCLVILYIGFLIKTVKNLENQQNVILPAINPIKLFISAIKAVIALAPSSIIIGLIGYYICLLINIQQVPDIILKTIIWIVLVSVVITSLMLYCEKERIADAFRFEDIFSKLGDVILTVIGLVLSGALLNIILCGIIGYVLWLLFGFGEILNFFMCFAIVFNFTLAGHYLGKAYSEGLGYRSSVD